ncbi:MAG: SMC family ATPase [Halobacteria archaeon]
MILRSLRLENVRSYKDLSIEFAPGITTILGPNGAGKSTLLQAVAWGLLGVGSPVSLRRHHAPFLRVTLEFQAHGRDYRVVRERKFEKGAMRSGASALYETTGGRERKVRWQERDITEEIAGITGLEPPVFQNAVLVAQGEIDGLTRATPAEREATISRLLGIEEMERVWERMGPVASEFEREAEGVRAALRAAEERRKEAEEARRTREEAARRANGLEGNLASLRRREEEARARWEGAEARRREALRLGEELKHTEAEARRSAQREREAELRLREAERAEGEAAALAEPLKRLPLLDSWEALLRDEARWREREAHAARLREQAARAEERARELRGAHEEWSRLAADVEALQRERDRLQAAAALAAKAESDLRALRERLASAGEELAAARKRFPFGEPDELAALHRSKVEEATRLQREMEEAATRASEARARTEAEESRVQRALAELERVSGPCPLCTRPLTEEHRSGVLRTYRADLARLRGEREAHAAALAEARSRLESARRSREEAVRLPVEAWVRVAREADRLRGEVARAESELSATAESVRGLGAAEARLKEVRGRRAALEPSAADYLAARRVVEQGRALQPEGTEGALAAEREALARRRAGLIEALGAEPREVAAEIARLREAQRTHDRLHGLAQQLPGLRDAAGAARRAREEAEGRRRDLDARLAPLRGAEPEAEAAKRAFEEARDLAARTAVELARAQESLRAEEERLKRLEAELGRAEEARERGAALEGLLSFLGRLRAVLSREGLQKELRARARPLLEKHASEMFGDFQLSYSSLRVTDDCNLLLVSPEAPDGLDVSAASGGERVAAALALRAAIARLLAGSRLELLILDEPTVHLDGVRRRELVPVLRGLGAIPQILVVTHDEELEAAADIVWRVKKENGASTVEVEAPGVETMASKMAA